MVTVKKPPVKRPARKAALPIEETPKKLVLESPKSNMDKAIDLIKWVDSPFKLFEVILLASVFFFGYFAWDSRVVILSAITSATHQPELKEVKVLEQISQRLLKDLEADTVLVHKVTLTVNNRTTLLAITSKGRENSLDGHNATLFSKDPPRNAAIMAMMAGEVHCDKLIASGKTSEWELKQGVTFICRGSIPPEMGAFEGYISLGFAKEPRDLGVVKTRINLAATEMAR